MGCDAWGIDEGYFDAAGHWHPTSDEARARLRRAMGEGEPSAAAAPLFVRVGEMRALDAPCDLTLEEGTRLRCEATLPPDLPMGYHELLRPGADVPQRLIVAPDRCYLPAELRQWGWAVQLYATRSQASWGLGDLADLGRLGQWARRLGSDLLFVNPLAAVAPTDSQEPSPYFPTSRRFRNPLYLAIEQLPGAAALGEPIARLAALARAMNDERILDRDRVWQLKREALERLFAGFAGDDRFEDYCAQQGEGLAQFATFCALAERQGGNWRHWPAEYRHPSAAAVARFAAEQRSRVRFFQWLQWHLDQQLAAAATASPLMLDLPIGFDPGGADAWAWQDLLAEGVSIGAPPDAYNTQGQNWQLPPFVPHRLRAAGYEPIVQTLRASFAHTAGLRIDHVMGLFRLFWIPEEAGAAQGAYIRYPADELMAIVAIESQRAAALVVGEDLGTVEPDVRQRLFDRDILSYRVLLFEDQPPGHFPHHCLGTVTTHDLPTIAGLWDGSDLAAQQQIGLHPNVEGTRHTREKLRAWVGADEGVSVSEVVPRVYQLLGTAPAAILTATLDDALLVSERPNMPGTTDQWPNWRWALPATIEQLEGNPVAGAIAGALDRGGE